MLKEIGRVISSAVETAVQFVYSFVHFIKEVCKDILSNLFTAPTISEQERENIKKILGLMENYFPTGNIGETLKDMDALGRVKTVENFARDLLNTLHLEGIEVEISYELPNTIMGQYVFSDKKIVLNGTYFNTDDPVMLREIIDTIVHETRHAMQFKALEGENIYGFSNKELYDWLYCLEHPIHAENDVQGYREQAIEQDAWGYAGAVLYLFENERG